MRSAKIKKLLIEELKSTPVVEAACVKVGVGRTTVYEWKKKDPKFAEAMRLAIQFGKAFMADISELQLFNLIKAGDYKAVALYLKTHVPEYGNKIEVTGELKHKKELDDEQKELIRKALRLASFSKPNSADV